MAEIRATAVLVPIIERFAGNAFAENGVEPEEAALVMEAVAGRFRRRAYDELVVSLLPPAEPKVTVHQEEGTTVKAEGAVDPEVLRKALDRVVIEEECAAE